MNREEVLSKVKHGILNYKELDDEFKNDKEITAIAFAKDKKLIKIIKQDFLNDEEFLKILINENIRRSELIPPELLLKKDFIKYFFDNKEDFFKRIDEKYQEQVASLFSEEEKQEMCFHGNMDLKYIDMSKISDDFIISCINEGRYGINYEILSLANFKQLNKMKILDEVFKFTGGKYRLNYMSDELKTSPNTLKSIIKHKSWITLSYLPKEAFEKNPMLAAELFNEHGYEEYIPSETLNFIKECVKKSGIKIDNAKTNFVTNKTTSYDKPININKDDKIVMMEIGTEKKKTSILTKIAIFIFILCILIAILSD